MDEGWMDGRRKGGKRVPNKNSSAPSLARQIYGCFGSRRTILLLGARAPERLKHGASLLEYLQLGAEVHLEERVGRQQQRVHGQQRRQLVQAVLLLLQQTGRRRWYFVVAVVLVQHAGGQVVEAVTLDHAGGLVVQHAGRQAEGGRADWGLQGGRGGRTRVDGQGLGGVVERGGGSWLGRFHRIQDGVSVI